MANTITFTAPDFLKKYVAEDIQERMMKELPAGMDDMPGGFPYDFTMPSALVMEEFANGVRRFTLKTVGITDKA